MKCRHCLVEFHAEWKDTYLGEDQSGHAHVSVVLCPACGRFNVAYDRKYGPRIFVYPGAISREPLDPVVPAIKTSQKVTSLQRLDLPPEYLAIRS
jgi:hypothetical protein